MLTIRTALCEWRDQLRGVVGGATRALQEVEVGAGDPADAAQGLCTADESAGVVDLSTTSLEQVVAAIKRIDDGTYGACERCEQQIALTRLQALPTVQFCIGCQHQEEQERRKGASTQRHPDGWAEDDDAASIDE